MNESFSEKIKNLFGKRFTLPKSEVLENAISAFTPTERIIFWVLGGIFALSAFILLAAVNQGTMVQIPQQGGTLVEGLIGTPNFINPLFATSDAENDLSSLLYSGLMRVDTNGNLIPDLAQSYAVSPDGRTYTFTLKNNLTFQDGQPLTTDDIAFTIQKATDPSLKSPRQANWDGVKVTVLSPTQIQFSLSQPYAAFLQSTTIGILPKHIWQNINNDEFSQLIELTGSGPYKLASITRNSNGIPTSYTLTAFDDYALGAPYIQTLIFKPYASEDDAIAAYENGDIQSLSTISPENVKSSVMSNSIVESSPLPRLFGVFFNQNQAPVFANKEVRQALGMVVDRRSIVSQVLDGYGTPITEPLPLTTLAFLKASTSTAATSTATKAASGNFVLAASPSISVPTVNIFGTTTTTLDEQAQTIAEAKELLAQNGWFYSPNDQVLEKMNGKSVEKLSFSIYTANTPELLETANILEQEWQQLGAQVSVKSFELGDLNETVIRPRAYDVLLFGEVVDQDSDLYAFWDSSQRNDPGLNVAMYTNSVVDKIVEQLRTTSDPNQRRQLFESFLTEFNADIPAIYLYSPDFIYIIPNTIQNFEMNQVTNPSDRFASITKWYIDTEHIWKIFEKNQAVR